MTGKRDFAHPQATHCPQCLHRSATPNVVCEICFDVQVIRTACFPGPKAQVSGWVCHLCLQYHRGHPHDIESRCNHGGRLDGGPLSGCVSGLYDRADIVFSIVYGARSTSHPFLKYRSDYAFHRGGWHFTGKETRGSHIPSSLIAVLLPRSPDRLFNWFPCSLGRLCRACSS